MFHRFFNCLARSKYLSIYSLSFIFSQWLEQENIPDDKISVSLFSLSIIFSQWSAGTTKSIRWQDLSIYLSFRFLLFSVSGQLEQQNQPDDKISVFISLFAFFYFQSVVSWNNKIHLMTRSQYLSLFSLFSFSVSGQLEQQNPSDDKISVFISLFAGGARGVMVIVVGIGHGDTSSNPGRDWLHFT